MQRWRISHLVVERAATPRDLWRSMEEVALMGVMMRHHMMGKKMPGGCRRGVGG